jgi:thiamine pyrophosphate-dependent acetolactate synthase large subunit-like protein
VIIIRPMNLEVFVSFAKGHGCQARRVLNSAKLKAVLRDELAADSSFLLEVKLTGPTRRP